MKIWQIMLGGAITVILTGQISPLAAFHAINFDVIFFLFGMFIIGQAIEDSGYLTHLCYKFFGKVKSVDKLVLAILLIMGIGSAFLMNDTLAIIGTPMMILLAKRNNISTKLLLLCLAFAITIGSVMSPIGNPQNLLIAMVGNIENPFLTFLKHLFIPTMLNLFLTYYLLKFFYKKDFNITNLQPGDVAITHIRLSRVARISLILVIFLILLKILLAFIHLFADVNFDFKLTYIALIGCSPILIYRFMSKKKKYRFHILRKIDWFTIVFFASMFVLMESVWQSGFFQNLMTELSLNMTSVAVILIISVIISQLISNVPMVALFLPLMISSGADSKEFMALAAGSTIAGNLCILGAASNVIIIQHAEKEKKGESISFLEFAKIGIPLTFVNVLVYLFFLI
ncbi:MAG TPA: SLC13 family permease [Smithella sp.]|nr:anion permease [Smithella sp.]HQO14533.1 SLC13 family permease [Smithellaceae bacterium]HNY49944.1 SLC13 family permease [Smithella sp.]HOG90472.1 SLC13 family permease [Smithella sp.]HOU50633.1 SLC13 family permease [Smithella sp.]